MEKSITSDTLKRSLIGMTSSLALLTAVPMAAAQTRNVTATEQSVDIPAGPLGEALFAVTDTFGVNILADQALTRGKRTSGASGLLSADEALDRLLAGSGLEYRRTSNGAYVLAKAQPATATSANRNNRTTENASVEEIVIRGKFQDSLIDRLPITVQELPFTLNTISRADLDKRNFIRRIDVLDTLPNVQIQGESDGLGTPAFTIRGFSAPLLVNNRNINLQRGAARDDSFIERYEVLKGPASIALGPVAGGGVINAVTKEPTGSDFTDLRFTSDQFGTINAEFDFNAANPFHNDGIGFRVSGAYRDFEFDAQDVERQEFAIQGVLSTAIGSRTSARATIAYKSVDGSPNQTFPLFNDGSVPPQFDTSTFFGLQNGRQDLEDRYFEGQLVHDFLDGLQLTLRASHQSSDLDLDSRNGLYNYLYDDGLPGASPENPVGYQYVFRFRNEVTTTFLDAQLSYEFEAFGQDQAVVFGGSYVDFGADVFLNFDSTVGPVRFDQLDDPRFGNPDVALPSDPVARNGSELKSVYGEFAMRPMRQLSIVGGLRYDVNDNFQNPEAADAEDLTWRLGASYELIENVNLFVSYAESFLPQFGLRREGGSVGPEKARNYEAGLKAVFLDGFLDVDIAVFTATRFNVAVPEPGAAIGENFSLAIGEQRNRGFEATISLDNGAGLDVDLTYGFLDQELRDNLEGGQLTSVPSHQVSLFATYEVQSGVVKGLRLGGGLRHFSKRDTNSPGVQLPSVTVADAVVSYPVLDDTNVALNLINITDSLYLESGGAGPGTLGGQQSFGAPRTFVFSIRTRF